MAMFVVALAVCALAIAAALIYHPLRTFGLRGVSVPIVRGWIPFIGCGLDFVRAPRAFLEQMRAQHGETFVTFIFGVPLLWVFHPIGLKSLYSIREADASFTEATRGLLGLKLPAEIVQHGDMRKFHAGLRKNLLPGYLRLAQRAVKDSLHTLGESGSFEIFAQMKMLVHRLGFLCWVGPSALEDNNMAQLITAFELLDPEESFKRLGSLVSTIATGKRDEKAALDRIESIITRIWKQRDADADTPNGDDDEEDIRDNLAALHALYKDLPEAERFRKVAIDVFHFHLASQANMYAALSWTLINLLTEDNSHLTRVLAEINVLREKHGDDFFLDDEVLDKEMKYTEAVIQESLRLAQQSITLRKVMRPCNFTTEKGTFDLPKGLYLGTLLSVTNQDELYIKEEFPLAVFRPERYLNAEAGFLTLDSKFNTSTFGHGFHACPGQRFALSVIKLCLHHILTSLELQPQFKTATVPPTSVGAIGRAEEPCIVRYKRLHLDDAS